MSRPDFVREPSLIEISDRDQNLLRALETNIINSIQEFGSSNSRTRGALSEAFRLGFTARGRGESSGQHHPPEPDWIRTERQKPFKLGDLVEWKSQSAGSLTTKQGVVVAVLPPGTRPNLEMYRSLAKKAGMGRDHESYIIKVEESHARGTYYWPLVRNLKLI